MITKIDGQTVRSADDLRGELDNLEVGKRVTLTVERSGSEHQLTVTLGSRPA